MLIFPEENIPITQPLSCGTSQLTTIFKSLICSNILWKTGTPASGTNVYNLHMGFYPEVIQDLCRRLLTEIGDKNEDKNQA